MDAVAESLSGQKILRQKSHMGEKRNTLKVMIL
jgi:hypothetical protein